MYSLYFKTTLLCFLSYLITNISRFSSTVHREIPFILFSHHSWTKEGNLFQLFIIIYLFIVNPLGYYIYHYCLNKSFKIKQPLRFYFNATLLSFIDLLLTLIGTILFIVPGYYLSYRLRFLPFYTINNYTQLNPIQIFKECWDNGTIYPITDFLMIDGVFAIIYYYFNRFEYLWILIVSMRYILHTILYLHQKEFNTQ